MPGVDVKQLAQQAEGKPAPGRDTSLFGEVPQDRASLVPTARALKGQLARVWPAGRCLISEGRALQIRAQRPPVVKLCRYYSLVSQQFYVFCFRGTGC